MPSHPAFRAFQEALPHTLPILAGFWFIAFAYGFYMHSLGFSFIYPMLMAMIIFGGSLEFVAVSMLLSPFAPWQTLLMAFTIQARHLFYGIAIMEKYNGMGWKKPFLIFMMCDETFALNYASTVPYDVDRGWFYFWISVLNYLYWTTGSALGGLLGNLIPFHLEGLSFVMTSLFLVIFLEQWMKEKNHTSAVIGLACSALSLILFGKDSFLIPAMAAIVILVTLFRSSIEKEGGFV